jgi:uncharacterized protein (DUF983 family)
MESKRRAGVWAFLNSKCPRCGKGKVFSGSMFNYRTFADTLYECPKCKLSYEPEPGFFFGAMYWSYALIVGTIIIGSITLSLLGMFDYAIYAIPLFIIIMLPLAFRHSRLLMLYVVYPLMYTEKFFGKTGSTSESNAKETDEEIEEVL